MEIRACVSCARSPDECSDSIWSGYAGNGKQKSLLKELIRHDEKNGFGFSPKKRIKTNKRKDLRN